MSRVTLAVRTKSPTGRKSSSGPLACVSPSTGDTYQLVSAPDSIVSSLAVDCQPAGMFFHSNGAPMPGTWIVSLIGRLSPRCGIVLSNDYRFPRERLHYVPP